MHFLRGTDDQKVSRFDSGYQWCQNPEDDAFGLDMEQLSILTQDVYC